PFACGTSVLGLIIMESIGWINWARNDPRIDSSRIGVIGNSGGGMMSMFLGALCPEIKVLSSSGYPTSFEFIARKEKKHCHCNILPGIVGRLEMWHVLGCFAPKPLFIFQGKSDYFFPEDIFYQTARKTMAAYERSGHPANVKFKVF